MNALQLAISEKFGDTRFVVINDDIWFFGEDIVRKLGYNLETDTYINYIKRFIKEEYTMKIDSEMQLREGIFNHKELEQGAYLINQNGLIKLIMNSPIEEAKKLQDWVIEEVIPSILTTGTYNMKQDSYMIEDPIERAKRWIEEEEVRRQLELDNQEKQKVIEKQEERIQEQETEIVHKEDVIISLTKDVTLKEKRQRIVDIVKYGAKGRYSERWGLLYKEFDGKFHINTKVRLERAKERGEVLKSTTRMDYICDVLGLTNELFDLCTVLFEADYIEMLKYHLDTAKR